MNESEQPHSLTSDLSADVLDRIGQIADTCQRPQSWVVARALRLYLLQEGEDILAIRRGRQQFASGQSHDMDDVMRELEAIVADKAA